MQIMPEPKQIETRDRALVYNADLATWAEAWQAIFRPSTAYAAINISGAGIHSLIPAKAGMRIKIISLFFTVAGEVNITLYNGTDPITGPMDFGGVSEPRGIVIPFPYSPLELTVENDLSISLSASVQISGSACYYYQ